MPAKIQRANVKELVGRYVSATIHGREILGKIDAIKGNIYLLNDVFSSYTITSPSKSYNRAYKLATVKKGILLPRLNDIVRDITPLTRKQYIEELRNINDRQQKILIGYSINDVVDGVYSFGCGAVKFTSTQIHNYIRILKKKKSQAFTDFLKIGMAVGIRNSGDPFLNEDDTAKIEAFIGIK